MTSRSETESTETVTMVAPSAAFDRGAGWGERRAGACPTALMHEKDMIFSNQRAYDDLVQQSHPGYGHWDVPHRQKGSGDSQRGRACAWADA